MSAFTRARGRSLVATATTALVIATLVPSMPAFADEGETTTSVTSIAGVVTDPSGAPATGMCLNAEVLEGGAWSPVAIDGEVRTDTAGAYAILDLADGTYAISAEACEAPFDTLRTWAPSLAAQPEVVDGSAANGIVVTGGATASAVDLALLPAAVTSLSTPSVSGDALVGSLLTADPGTWSVSELSFTHQWLRDGTPITDATGETYTATLEDANATLSVEVLATRDGWADASATSEAVGPVLQAFAPGANPAIAGEARFGSTLTATVGGWPEDATISWQWSRNGEALVGAVGDSHVIAVDDVDATFTVSATITKAGFAPVTVVSAATGAIGSATLTAATPTIGGTAKVGQTLTAAAGAWSPAIVPSFAWLRDGIEIPGATGTSYTLAAADLGKKLSVRATGSLAGYTTESCTSAATAAVIAGTLVTSTPVIAGAVKVGSPLTVTPGWTPGAAYSYVWKRGTTVIAGATKSSYTPTSTDLGAKLTVTVTGTLAGYTGVTRSSAATVAVAVGTFTAPVPTISGTIAVGRTVTAVPGVWKPAAAFTYQWKRNGAAITGATKSTYAITATDLKTALSVTVTGKASAVTTRSLTSKAIAVAYGTLAAPAPTMSGTRAVGKTLTAVPGAWSPSGVTLSYQWKRAGVVVTGATKSTYVLTASDLGKSISVTVTGKKAGFASAAKTSAGTALVAAGTLSGPTPTISGTRTVGKTLTAVPGTWAPSGVALTYQWKRAGVAITGATKSTYVLTASDLGNSMTVTVTGKKSGYTTLAKNAGGTARIAAGTISFSPKLSGTQRAGSKLTVTVGTVSPGGTTVKYQWYRNGTAISGKTASTYTLGNVDAGKVVSVTITATKAGHTTKTATLKTATVAYRPASFSGDYWFRVGIDVKPGTYYTSSTSTTNCRWWRTTSMDGAASSTLGYDPGGSGRRMITILATDRYVAAIGCGSWILYDGTGNPSSTMAGNGIAAVGTMLKPGRYVSYGNSECWAADWSAPAGDEGHYIGGGTYDGDLYWIVEPGTFFETYNCNTFTRYAD
ncbi:hypothetical protein [Agromyces sp. Leaf222]|uniref:hypothetical protein n=1 Tax=Agromyces sp. Leaf222 TaxID=1735688 RepID=UPI0007013931|nr:hypothetical protein [Agromyces sp. Leaf222]KQM82112.1 hypothetical protein ASE68_01360 [Agromyces sp. Leaf222]